MANNTTETPDADTTLGDIAENVDAMFLLFNAIIVSLMQPGFACLEAGCVNSKNVTNIMIKNVLDMLICVLCFWLVGYSLAYCPGNSVLGYSQWAGVGLPETSMAHWFFQFIFAATAATILSGAVAERCNFVAYIVYCSVISGIVYPVAVHWAWTEGGMLALMGFKDFAGSGVVHTLAGTCSFVAAALIGPRIGRFDNGAPVDKPGHSIPLMAIGGLLLFTGFLAFNGGSQGHITAPGDGAVVARAITNTVLCGAGAGLLGLAITRLGLVGPAAWGFSITLNAALTGMVAVCAGAESYSSLGALVGGAVSCLVYLLLRSLVLYLRVDDPLDAVAVHFGGGFWGLISAPVFARGGIVYGVNEQSLLALWHNVAGGLIIVVWAAVCSVILFGFLHLNGCLRVTEEEELEGLDVSKHNEPAYPITGWHVTHPINMHLHSTFQKNGSYTLNQHGPRGPTMTFDNLAMEMDNRQRYR